MVQFRAIKDEIFIVESQHPTLTMHFKALASLTLLYALSGAAAAPPTVQDVWSPRITYPTAGAVWRAEQKYTITW